MAGCLVVGHHPSGIQVRQWVSSSADHSLLAVVNNAGVGSGGLIDWLTLSDFERDAAVNYFGTVRVSKAFLPLLKQAAAHRTRRAPRPRVVVVCSASGKVGVNTGGGGKAWGAALGLFIGHGVGRAPVCLFV